MRRRQASKTTAKTAARHLADPRQAAILLLRRIELRNADRGTSTTRAQFTAPMLRRLSELATAYARIPRTRLRVVGRRWMVLLQCRRDLCRCSHQCG